MALVGGNGSRAVPGGGGRGGGCRWCSRLWASGVPHIGVRCWHPCLPSASGHSPPPRGGRPRGRRRSTDRLDTDPCVNRAHRAAPWGRRRAAPCPAAGPARRLDAVRSRDDATDANPPPARRACARAARARCRRRASAASSTSSRRWTTSSASGWGSPTSTRRRRSSRRASRALREGRTPLHEQLRDDRAARAPRRPPRAAVRRPLRPGDELLITVGASEAVDLALRATCDPGDEVILHEPSYVAYVPAIVFAGGVVRHVATRFEDDFALDPAAVEAAITPRTKALFLGYPCNPTGAVLPDDVQEPRRHRRAPRPARVQRRDLRPARLRHVPPPRVQLAAGDARADDPDGRLLEGVRDDRLAGRLRGAGGRSSRASSRSTSTGSCRRRPPPRTPRSWRSSRARRTSSGWSPSTTAAGACSSTASTRSGSRRSSRAAPSTRSRGSRSTPALTTRRSPSACSTEERVAVVPGAFGPSGAGHVRMCCSRRRSRASAGSSTAPSEAAAPMTAPADAALTRAPNATSPSSGSRSTASSRPREDVLRLLHRRTTARRRTPTSARSASACRVRCRRSTGAAVEHVLKTGARDRRDVAPEHTLGAQELLLPRPAEGLPDQPVRPAARLAADA